MDAVGWIGLGIFAIVMTGLVIASLVSSFGHLFGVVGPVLRHLGIDSPWAVDPREVEEELKSLQLSWDMRGKPVKPTTFGWLKEKLLETRPPPNQLRFPSGLRLTIEETDGETGEGAYIDLRLPAQIDTGQALLIAIVRDARFPGARLTKQIVFRLWEERHPLSIWFGKEEFPVSFRIKLLF